MNIYGQFEIVKAENRTFSMEEDGRPWPHFGGLFTIRHRDSGLEHMTHYRCGIGVAFPESPRAPLFAVSPHTERVFREIEKPLRGGMRRGTISIWLSEKLEELASDFLPSIRHILDVVASEAGLYATNAGDLDSLAADLGIEKPSKAIEAFDSCRDSWDYLTRCGLCADQIQALADGDLEAVDS